MDTFQKRLTTAMLRAGLTQTALAERMGITKGALNQWTSGATTPSPANMVKVASILGIDPYYLRTGDPQPVRESEQKQNQQIADLWAKLLPEQQAELISLIENMIARNQQTLAELLRRYGNAVPDDRVAQFLPPVPQDK